MAADFTALQQQIDALSTQVEATEGTEASAIKLIAGFSAAITKAVTEALTADDAADNGSIQAASAAIATVKDRFTQSAAALGDAVAANPGA